MENIFSQSLVNNFKRNSNSGKSVAEVIPFVPQFNFSSQYVSTQNSLATNEQYKSQNSFAESQLYKSQSFAQNSLSEKPFKNHIVSSQNFPKTQSNKSQRIETQNFPEIQTYKTQGITAKNLKNQQVLHQYQDGSYVNPSQQHFMSLYKEKDNNTNFYNSDGDQGSSFPYSSGNSKSETPVTEPRIKPSFSKKLQRELFKTPEEPRKTNNILRALENNDSGIISYDDRDDIAESQFSVGTPHLIGKVTQLERYDREPIIGAESMSQSHCYPLQTPSGDSIPFKKRNGEIEMLRSVKEIPAKYRSIFPFEHFNALQSKVFDEVMYTDNPLVVCSPTGSGKTVLFELSIIRMLMRCVNASLNYKAVYMAPIKALCSERFEDWKRKFTPFGLKCLEMTGDTEIDDFQELQMSHVVFTTPEKWDSMTRKWKDNRLLVQSVRLFLIDEVHLLNDNVRGATMEAVVSRMKTVQVSIKNDSSEQDDLMMRFIAISATIPNVHDIAGWLDTGILPAKAVSVGDEYRPVALRKIVLGYPYYDKQTDFKFDFSLNYKLSNIIQTYSENKPSLVFCCTRKGVIQGAGILVKDARFIMDYKHKQRLTQYTSAIHDNKLQEYVMQGVGFHHAGLDTTDRKCVEDMFSRGELPVLFCTSTLAMGVNLPAHLVVIKGTMHYVMGGYEEYSEAQLLQMMGRAGRPQFDTSATAVIMTKTQNKVKYEAMMSGTQKIESSLHHHLTEHINAEVVLGTITNIDIAREWLKSTFLFKRMQENPKYYGAPEGLDKTALGNKLQAMSLRALKSLQSYSLLDIRNEDALISTELGKLMARYCIAFDTIKMISECKGMESIEELLQYLSKAKEFSDMTVRQNEKKILNTLNKDKNRKTIRYPINSKIKTTDQKINCLFQTALGCLQLNDFSLSQDTTKIMRIGQRVARFMMEFFFNIGGFKASLNSILLYKNMKARLWDDSKYVSRQIEKIGPTLSSALVNSNITSFQKMEETNPRELEMIMNRHPPFGNQIKEIVAALPKYDVIVQQETKYQPAVSEINIKVELLNVKERSFYLKSRKLFQQGCILIIGDSNNSIVFKQKLSDSHLIHTGVWTRKITVYRSKKSPELSINLISLDYVGLDVQSSFTPMYHGNYSNYDEDNAREQTTCTTYADVKVAPQKKTPSACNHRCTNKMWCGHKCCKESLTMVPSSVMKTPKLKSKSQKRGLVDQEDVLQHISYQACTPINRFCNEMERRKINLPNVQPLKKIKLELTLGHSTPRAPSSTLNRPSSRSFESYKYNANKVKQADTALNPTSSRFQENGGMLSQVSHFQSIRTPSLAAYGMHDESINFEDESEFDYEAAKENEPYKTSSNQKLKPKQISKKRFTYQRYLEQENKVKSPKDYVSHEQETCSFDAYEQDAFSHDKSSYSANNNTTMYNECFDDDGGTEADDYSFNIFSESLVPQSKYISQKQYTENSNKFQQHSNVFNVNPSNYPVLKSQASNKVSFNDGKVSFSDGKVSFNNNKVSFNDDKVSFNDGKVSFNDGKVLFNNDKVSFNGNKVLFNDNKMSFNGNKVLYNDVSLMKDREDEVDEISDDDYLPEVSFVKQPLGEKTLQCNQADVRETHFNDISGRLNNNGPYKPTANISQSNDDQNEELTMNKYNKQNVDKNISFNSSNVNNFDKIRSVNPIVQQVRSFNPTVPKVRSVNPTVPMKSEKNFYNKNQAATKLYGEILSRTDPKLDSNTALFKNDVMGNSNLPRTKVNELRYQKLDNEDNIKDIKSSCSDQMNCSFPSSERLPQKIDDHWRRSVFTTADSTEDYGFTEHEETTRSFEVDASQCFSFYVDI